RIARVDLQLAPHVLDMRIDRAIERLAVLAADSVEQLRAREDAPWLSRHRGNKLKLGGCEVDGPAGPRDYQPLCVQDEIAELQPGGRSERRSPAKDGSHSRDQLTRAEWLREVVVCSRLESEQPVSFFDASGHHDDRNRRLAPQRSRNLQTVDAWQPEVQHDE